MSPIFKTLKTLNNYYVYDRNKNALITITADEYQILNRAEKKFHLILKQVKRLKNIRQKVIYWETI